MKYPICQMKNKTAEYRVGDDVYVIREDGDYAKVELTSQDMRTLMEWRSQLIRIHDEASGA